MARIRRHQFDFINELDFHHIGIEVPNLERAQQFFVGILGYSIKDRVQFGDEMIVFIEKENHLIELVQSINQPIDEPEYHFAFSIKDIRNLTNMNWLEPPTTYPNGWISAFMEGPNNILIECIQLTS